MKLTFKKGIALLLALTFAISLFSSLIVFGGGSTSTAKFYGSANKSIAKAGDEVEVTIGFSDFSASVVTGFKTILTKVWYDPAVFDYKSFTKVQSVEDRDWTITQPNYDGNAATGEVLCSFNDLTPPTNSLVTGDAFKVTFTVRADAPKGASTTIRWTNEDSLNKATDRGATGPNSKVTMSVKTDGGYAANASVLIDSDYPNITFDNYTTTPTNQDITVNATTDKGTLNVASHTFTENGSFDFVSTNTVDGTPYVTTKTVTISNIDKTKPTISDVTDGGLYNTDKTVTFSDNVAVATAKLDGNAFTSGSSVGEGSHTLVVTDTAGNSTSVSFTIDKTAPVVTGVEDGKTYGTDRTITFVEGTATLDGNAFTSGTTVSAEKIYVLVVTDTAGNKTTINFTINKQVPIVTGVTEGGLYNTSKTITFDKGTATLNGNAFTNGATVSAEGDYTLVVTDTDLGLSTTIHFTIDKTGPAVGGVTDGGIYNTTKSITFFEGTATLNGNAYTSGTAIAAEGEYTIIVTDAAGNKTTVTFTIDKTAPTASGVTNNGLYNTDKTITFTEGTATLNGISYTSGTVISAEGNYTFVLTDTAGNKTTITFTIDKTAPTVGGLTNGGSYKTSIAIIVSEGTATLNGQSYSSGTTINNEGTYTFVITDAAGNSNTIIFTIDKTAPIITIGNYSTNPTNQNITVTASTNEGTLNYTSYTFTANGSFEFVATDAAGNVTKKTVIITNIDKVYPNITLSTYVTDPTNKDITITATTNEGSLNAASHTFTENGSFEFIATDNAGNVTKRTVTITNIDKTEPVITIGNYNTNPTNQNITVTVSTNEGTLNYTSHTFTQNGSFEFVATDAAGNVTKKTVTITNIDKTAPVITIDAYNTAPTEGNITVTASTNEGTLNATSHTFTSNGSFTFTATDAAGNVTSETVTITNIIRAITDITLTSDSPAFVTVGDNYELRVNIADFNTNEDGIAAFEADLSFDSSVFDVGYLSDLGLPSEAFEVGSIVNISSDLSLSLIAPGIIKILYVDSNGGMSNTHIVNSGTLCKIRFKVKNGIVSGEYAFALKNAVAASSTMVETKCNITNTSVSAYAPHNVSGIADMGIYNTDKIITIENGTATLNDEPFISGSTVKADGIYFLTVTDYANNTFTYTFMIDKTAPVEASLTASITELTNKDIEITILFPEDAMVKQYSLDNINWFDYSLSFMIGSNLTVYARSQDGAGNWSKISSYAITNIDKIAPVINISDYDTSPTNQDIVVIATTNEGKLNMLGYRFTQNGSITFIATDDAGNVTKKTVTITNIDKTAPTVYNVSDNELYTEQRTIEFNEGKATLNGIEILSGTVISHAGDYVLEVKDDAGNSTLIHFTICFLNNFDVNNGRIFIKAQSVTSLIKNGFTLSNGADIIVKHLDGSILNEVEYAGTGMKVCITIGGIVKKEFTAVITGDVSGDGFINAIDLLLIKRSILGMTALTDAYAEAANIDRDANGSITAIDLLKLKRFVLGIDTIA